MAIMFMSLIRYFINIDLCSELRDGNIEGIIVCVMSFSNDSFTNL